MENSSRHINIDLLTRSVAGEVSAQEQQEVEIWIAASKANRREYEALRKAWDLLDGTHPGQAIDIDTEWEYHKKILHGKGTSGKRIRLNPFIRLAAVLVILFGIGLLILQTLPKNAVKTRIAETETIVLPDGSRVTLNASSKLSYADNFGDDSRQVALKGEAYFEVKRDTARPFRIMLEGAEIQVLGTAFNVRAYKSSDKIEVTVSEGKVSFYDKKRVGKKVIITPGEKAEFNRLKKTVTKQENDDRNYLSWKTRKMIFEDDALSDVAATVSRVYHTEIIVDDNLKNCRLTTRFEDKDLDTVLEILESTFDLTSINEKGVIQLSGSGCE